MTAKTASTMINRPSTLKRTEDTTSKFETAAKDRVNPQPGHGNPVTVLHTHGTPPPLTNPSLARA